MSRNPVTQEELANDPEIILRQKGHAGQPIECGYNGKVGAIFQNGKYFIISPNMDYIPEPANNQKMLFRTDCRLGDDDHLQWPQQYVELLCHFPLIPRFDQDTNPNDPIAILLYPYEEDFFVMNSTGSLVGLGHLRADILAQLTQILEGFEQQKNKYEQNLDYSRTPVVESMIARARRYVGHMERLPMTRKQLKFIFCESQRHMLEFHALFQYLTDVQPKMRQLTSHTGNPMKMVGAFFSNPSDADLYFKAGVPVWLVLPARSAGTLRVDALVEMTKAADILIMTPNPVDHHHVYYTGRPDTQKYDFFRVYLRRYLSGSNPFKGPNDEIQSSFGSLAGSSSMVSLQPSSTTSSASSSHPSSTPAPPSSVRRSKKSNSSTRTEPYTRPKLKNNSRNMSRKKLFEPSSPLIPLSIPAWSTGLSDVDTDPANRVSEYSNCPGGFAFPDPALFVGMQTEAKQALYFANWLHHRSALLFRVSMPNSTSKPINNQLWRTLLNTPLGDAPGVAESQVVETKSSRRIQIIQEILSNCINSQDGVLINENTQNRISWRGNDIIPGNVPPVNVAREILWEICELNFRSELVALNQRAYDPPPTASSTPEEHEAFIGQCLFGGDAFAVRIEDANKGLADPILSQRREYVLGLYRVMKSWAGFDHYTSERSGHLLARISTGISKDISNSDIEALEGLLAGFYTQSFFNFFGRAPILPRRL